MIFKKRKKAKAEKKEKNSGKTWFTVGMKLTLGVAVVSNLCIGVLLYDNRQASRDVGETTTRLIETVDRLNKDLRSRMMALQTRFLTIPQALETDPARKIVEWLEKNYTLTGQTILEGRENYARRFKRSRIEAARAGSAGKGFAVVAAEVRALSTQTEDANQEIADKVGAIQEAGRAIIDCTQETDKGIEELIATSALISTAAREQQAFTDKIASNVDDTAEDSRSVCRRISSVKDAAENSRSIAENVHAYSREISESLDHLLWETKQKLSRMGQRGQNDVRNIKNIGEITESTGEATAGVVNRFKPISPRAA